MLKDANFNEDYSPSLRFGGGGGGGWRREKGEGEKQGMGTSRFLGAREEFVNDQQRLGLSAPCRIRCKMEARI